eukprot:gene14508-4281_t
MRTSDCQRSRVQRSPPHTKNSQSWNGRDGIRSPCAKALGCAADFSVGVSMMNFNGTISNNSTDPSVLPQVTNT